MGTTHRKNLRTLIATAITLLCALVAPVVGVARSQEEGPTYLE